MVIWLLGLLAACVALGLLLALHASRAEREALEAERNDVVAELQALELQMTLTTPWPPKEEK